MNYILDIVQICLSGTLTKAELQPHAGSRPFGNNPSHKRILNPSPEVLDPPSRRGRRYAEAPATAFLTGLRIAVGPASRLRRRYADAPAAAFLFSFLSVPAVRLNFFI
jgi:hypothetical protein